MEGSVESRLGEILTQHGLTLATAESCTGGLIASRITDVAGSSAYFLGGVVAYSNQIKEKVLKVREETLLQHGAVSRQTVEEMASGVSDLYAVDVAISISGIMGPAGGSSEKPVGTTWVCVLVEGDLSTQVFKFTGDRSQNKLSAAEAALGLLHQNLLAKYA